MRTPETFHEDLILGLVEGSSFFVPGILESEEVPTWDNFLRVVDRAGRRGFSDTKIKDPLTYHQVRDVLFRGVQHLDVTLNQFEDLDDLQILDPVLRQLRHISPGIETFEYRKLALDLIGGKDSLPIDRSTDLQYFYVQCSGSVEFNIYSSADINTKLETKVLDPGDAVFISSGHYFSSKALTASAAVLFGIKSPDN